MLDSGALDVPALMGQARVPQLYHDAFGSDPAYWASVSPLQQLNRNALPMLLVCSSTRHFPPPCDEARKNSSNARATLVHAGATRGHATRRNQPAAGPGFRHVR